MSPKKLFSLAIVLLVAGTTACAPVMREQIKPGDPNFAPVSFQELRQPAPVDGSIASSAPGFTLFGDKTAHRQGDLLTVLLQETTRSSKSAETSMSKEADIAIGNPRLFGRETSLGGLDLSIAGSSARSFDGEAEADQSNSLNGSISVTVSEVLPNGLLRIRGEKWLTLTEGDEYIRLSGLVRSDDIGVDNTVMSNKIADARIAYSGTGSFADANRQGWLGRFFNSEWWPL
ncbi:flagellar basal body L-ring protein FlgH [Allohahella marinimesophila]|uniref:Flagellar L-ring protein n=2 Tax=Allohahella marinimesophila TaxID=1054972 RepID=A0ABP7NTI1_9GAMM